MPDGAAAEADAETEDDIAAMIAIPSEVPSWEIALKTAPAKA